MKNKIYWKVLTERQKELLPKLKFLKEKDFYLGGGTALALQIGHRASMDFDFYTRKEFDDEKISQMIIKQLPQAEIETQQKNTILGRVVDSGLSLFHYPYPVIKPLVVVDNYVNLLSLEDLVAMKLIALAQRGTRRDFIDLYFLIDHLGLKKSFQSIKKKYPRYDSYHVFLALTYFRNAEDEEKGRYKMLKPIPEWSKMKEFFIKKTQQFKEQEL